MAFNQGALKKITDAPTAVESVVSVLAALVEDQTFPVDSKDEIACAQTSLLKHPQRAELEKAILSNITKGKE